MTTTTQPSGTSNSTVATTAFVHNNLIDYALLNPTLTQTFTGNNNFPTQTTTDNSTLVSTTAFIKNQNYITQNALTNYSLLDTTIPQTFTGDINVNTQITTDNSTLVANTAYVQSQNYLTQNALTGYSMLDPLVNPQIWGNNQIPPSENWFHGDIYTYKGVSSTNGFYVTDGPNGLTSALIDTSGNLATETASVNGIISSNTGINIPSLYPVFNINNNGTIIQSSTGTNNFFNTMFTGTSNQVLIKSTSNVAPSTISQTTGTLNITAITNNTLTPQTTILLASRTTTNTSHIILNSNNTVTNFCQASTTLNIGSSTTTTNINSIYTVFGG